MSISVSISTDLDKLVGWAHAMQAEQLPFATALALNAVAQDAADELARVQPRHLDRPTPFTQKAWAVWRAKKDSLTATVFAKDAQAKYLRWQINGGVRQPNRVALRLPANIKLDQFGNLPKGEIARLVAAAKAGKRVTKARGRRIGLSSKVDLFYGQPDDGRPAGIYKRVVDGEQHHLVPLIVFPQRGAEYRPRLPMADVVRQTVRTRIGARFAEAWAQAVRTAR